MLVFPGYSDRPRRFKNLGNARYCLFGSEETYREIWTQRAHEECMSDFKRNAGNYKLQKPVIYNKEKGKDATSTTYFRIFDQESDRPFYIETKLDGEEKLLRVRFISITFKTPNVILNRLIPDPNVRITMWDEEKAGMSSSLSDGIDIYHLLICPSERTAIIVTKQNLPVEGR